MTGRSTPEVKQVHLEAFGQQLGPVYHALYDEVVWLHAKWLEYRKLFGQSPERVQLLNEVAPFYFSITQDVYWHDVLLHIARLTDPPRQGSFENLSLFQLVAAVPEANLRSEVDGLIDVATERAGFARAYRNKYLAHSDIAHALGRAEPLTQGSRQDVEDALAAIAMVLNRLSCHYLDSETAFRSFLSGDGEADSLVAFLSLGLDVERGRRARAKAGISRPEDFDPPSVP